MAKTKGNKAVINTNEKIVTKYDKKVAKRKAEEVAAAKAKKITKLVCGVVFALVVVIASIMAVNEYNKINKEYIKVAGESVNKIEFDFYYSLAKNNMLGQSLGDNFTYADYLKSYMGYDSSKSDASQEYIDGYTWFDYFANSAIDSMKEYAALNKMADEAGFSYNSADDDYNAFVEDMQTAADEAGQSLSKYYKTVFGEHASQSALEVYLKEYLRADAYMDSLKDSYTPSDEDIKKYYQEHKEDYDLVSYRFLEIKAEDTSSEDSKTAARKKAYEMLDVVVDEPTFISACTLFATDPTNYEDNKDYSLKVDMKKSSITNDDIADWVFSDSRIANDKTVIEDAETGTYTVVLYVSRMEDESSSQTISDTIVSEKYRETIDAKTENMEVDLLNRKIKTFE